MTDATPPARAPGFLEAMFVIARRDIVATVVSRGFLIWLATPVLALGFGLLLGLLADGGEATAEPTSVALIDAGGDFVPWLSETAKLERARSRYDQLRGRFRTLREGEDLPAPLERPGALLTSPELAALADGGLSAIEEDHELGTSEVGRALGLDRREPALTVIPASAEPDAQAARLLRPGSERFGAVLIAEEPGLRILRRDESTDVARLRVLAARAWDRRAAEDAGIAERLEQLRASSPEVTIETVPGEEEEAPAGRGLSGDATTLGTGAALAVFMLISLLAGALLSNMVEEKGNKVIEILVASVPVPAIFAGKLAAMVVVSLIGISVWGLLFGGGAAFILGQLPAGIVPDPARGWPEFVALALGYFVCAYLIYGAIYLGIGSLCTSIREVQTLSMPVTIVQMLVLVVVLQAVSSTGFMHDAASWFPLSAPYMMAARAAEGTGLGIHALAFGWQLLFAGIVIFVASRLFRYGVLRSGPPPSVKQLFASAGSWLRPNRASTLDTPAAQ